jgi:hypothetical protein
VSIIQVEGLAQLTLTLDDLRDASSGLQAAVLRAGMAATAEAMRNTIDDRVAGVRRAVGYRFNKRASPHELSGKVGVNVGKRIPGRTSPRDRPGVGIGAANWHWWVLGSYKTPNRQARTYKGKAIRAASRGAMPAQQPLFAQQAANRARASASAAMQAVAKKYMTSFARNHR